MTGVSGRIGPRERLEDTLISTDTTDQQANHGKLIVVDPRRSATAEWAALHLRLRPGSDAALANGLLHILVRDDLIDPGYIRERTEGFEEVRGILATYWPERVERLTGVSEAQLTQAAHILGSASTAMVLTARGPEQQAQGVNNTLAYINIALALGEARGARLHELCLYEWLMPEDPEPLKTLVREFLSGELDAVAFTSQIQCRHLFQIATELGQADMGWFCLFYGVTFGGYVGLSSFLPLFLHDHYRVTPVMAGSLTALAALVGSGVRPLGGYVADRVGGVRLLLFLLLSIGLTYAAAARLPALVVMESLLVFGMACLGMGNGAVFQLVPQRFQAEIGVATGVVGAVGGVGGFLLPTLLGNLNQLTGSFGPGFLALLAFGAACGLQTLLTLQAGWRHAWRAPAPAGSTEFVAVLGEPTS